MAHTGAVAEVAGIATASDLPGATLWPNAKGSDRARSSATPVGIAVAHHRARGTSWA